MASTAKRSARARFAGGCDAWAVDRPRFDDTALSESGKGGGSGADCVACLPHSVASASRVRTTSYTSGSTGSLAWPILMNDEKISARSRFFSCVRAQRATCERCERRERRDRRVSTAVRA
jgi:hypothetical protein